MNSKLNEIKNVENTGLIKDFVPTHKLFIIPSPQHIAESSSRILVVRIAKFFKKIPPKGLEGEISLYIFFTGDMKQMQEMKK